MKWHTVVAVLSLTLGNRHNLYIYTTVKFHWKREARLSIIVYWSSHSEQGKSEILQQFIIILLQNDLSFKFQFIHNCLLIELGISDIWQLPAALFAINRYIVYAIVKIGRKAHCFSMGKSVNFPREQSLLPNPLPQNSCLLNVCILAGTTLFSPHSLSVAKVAVASKTSGA